MADTPTVDVTIPVDRDAAPALDDAATRALVGRVVSRMLEPSSVDALATAITELKVQARARGLTDAMIDAELDAYNAERRGTDALPPM